MKQEKGNALSTILAGQTIKLAIISDPHLYYRGLGTTGPYFEEYLKSQCYKMEAESEAILESALNIIIRSDAQVVLIPGDMTNNGEEVNHKLMVSHLKKLTDAGKQVVVINGNHDILNPDAKSYAHGTALPVRMPSITPAEFRKLYSAFGYDKAVDKDTKSLSYTIDLADDVRLIAIDSCQYSLDNEHHITKGDISGDKLTWVEKQIKDAKDHGKIVLGMMHHGIVPHFSTQTAMFPGFVVDNYMALQADFSSWGLQVMFTGHFHSQDLSGKYFADKRYMLEIETGSLINYPVPIRFVEVSKDRKWLNITSKRVQEINYKLPKGTDFTKYTEDNISRGSKEMFLQQVGAMLSNTKIPSTVKTAEELAAKVVVPGITVSDLFVRAAMAHYHGDEDVDPATKKLMQGIAASKDPIIKGVGENMVAMVTDVPPADNNVRIDLRTGKASR